MSKAWDSYFIEGTQVLKNIPNIKDKEELSKYEAVHSALNINDFMASDFEITFDTENYKEIHKSIFSDIYPFAGEFRKVDMRKVYTEFCPSEMVESELSKMLFEIECNRDLLKKPKWLAFYFSGLNMVHPFREGNGRTCRTFWTKVLEKEGLYLDFTKWSREENAMACDAAFRLDYKPLEDLIKRTITTIDDKSLKLSKGDKDI